MSNVNENNNGTTNSIIDYNTAKNSEHCIYMGAVDKLNDLNFITQNDITKNTIFTIINQDKIPLVWVKEVNQFMYLIDWKWEYDTFFVDNVIFKDNDLMLKAENGETIIVLFKKISDIEFDDTKISNIILAALEIEDDKSKDLLKVIFNLVERSTEFNDILKFTVEDRTLEDIFGKSTIGKIIDTYIYWKTIQDNINYKKDQQSERGVNKYYKYFKNESNDNEDEENKDNSEEPFVFDNQYNIVNAFIPDTILIATVRKGSKLSSRYIKIIEDNKDDGLEKSAYIDMEDDTRVGANNVVFTEQDLLSIVKSRIMEIKDIDDEFESKPFEDDNILDKVIEKVTEAQMWLDLWGKIN